MYFPGRGFCVTSHINLFSSSQLQQLVVMIYQKPLPHKDNTLYIENFF